MNRAGFMQFILEQYSVEPDYPWMKNPNFAVFRHSNNQKWFALIMDIPRSRLGLPGDESIDVVNLKEKCDAPECNPTVCRKARNGHEL